MKVISEHKYSIIPKVSLILLDWSCRESFHSLDYLNEQTVLREQYEIIWIEYYSRHSPDIEVRLKEYERLGKPPIIDKWIIMEMPKNVYYHKHLMFNIGIIASKGEIITFCDSDAIFRPTFVESIIKTFKEDSNIVLHMDEVRNTDKGFYPFNYPSVDKIIGRGCVNWKNSITLGLLDKEDPLHTRNYGACMCALRKDLIDIGGADEHIDYLGHICGPYEMTFRLVNSGKKELWHQNEWLYHVWHPGQAGDKNFAGPHDGLHMSQIALSARRTKRIFPLVKNPAIRSIRYENNVSCNALFSIAVSKENTKEWEIDKKSWSKVKYLSGSTAINLKERNKNKTLISLTTLSKNPLFVLRFYNVFVKIFLRDVHTKLTFIKGNMKGLLGFGIKKGSITPTILVVNPKIKVNGIVDLIRRGFNFLKYLFSWPNYVIDRCWHCLHDLTTIGIQEIALFGIGNVSQVLCLLSRYLPIKITAIYDNPVKKMRFMGREILPIETIKGYRGKVIITSFDDIFNKVEMLKKLGVDNNAIVDLW